MNHLFIILAMLAPSWGEPSPQPVHIAKTRTLNAGIATAPERKLRRTEVPEPLGATMITSTFFGGTTPVCSL